MHGDQVAELSVQLEVQEREEKGEDGEGQIEVEEENVEIKEKRSWMTVRMGETQEHLEPRGACDPTSKSVTKIARSQCMLRCCACCACSCSCHCTCC